MGLGDGGRGSCTRFRGYERRIKKNSGVPALFVRHAWAFVEGSSRIRLARRARCSHARVAGDCTPGREHATRAGKRGGVGDG